MLNYWKKQEEREENPIDFNKRIIIEQKSLLDTETWYIYNETIIPNSMIENKIAYDIIEISNDLIMRGLIVATNNELVKHVSILGNHPNRDETTQMFCLAAHHLNTPFTEEYFYNILKIIKTYYLDDCYFTPHVNDIKYEKINSISI